MGGSQSEFKVVIVGLQGAGKTCFCNLMWPKEQVFQTDAFVNFHFPLTSKSCFDVWDLNGRLPHLWSHQMGRAAAIIFVIDQKQADNDGDYLFQVSKVSKPYQSSSDR